MQVNGTHYVTLEGLVESPTGSNSFAVVSVSPADGTITIAGGGYASGRVLQLPPKPATAPALGAARRPSPQGSSAAGVDAAAANARADVRGAGPRPRAVAGQA
jgi:hypothetical protein